MWTICKEFIKLNDYQHAALKTASEVYIWMKLCIYTPRFDWLLLCEIYSSMYSTFSNFFALSNTIVCFGCVVSFTWLPKVKGIWFFFVHTWKHIFPLCLYLTADYTICIQLKVHCSFIIFQKGNWHDFPWLTIKFGFIIIYP